MSVFSSTGGRETWRRPPMQQSTICRDIESAPLTSDEIHVAQVLLDITTMIRTFDSGSPLEWGSRKRRSRFSHRKTDVGVQQASQQPKAAAAAAASSPITPLAFESDDKRSKHILKKKSKKMSRGKYMEMIEELSQRRDLLRREIEGVTIYYNKLIAQNSQLKAMMQEVKNSRPRKEEVKLETSIIVGNKVIPKNNEIQTSLEFCWIPDLNVCGEEMELDRRSRFAEARRRRMDILRVKSSKFKFQRTR